jgi:hypothetical protein
MFEFSVEQDKVLEKDNTGKSQQSPFLVRMVQKFCKAIQKKLFDPCSASGMYMYQDFED